MKNIILEISFDDTDGYKGHGEDTAELIKSAMENQIRYDIEADGVVKEGWKVNLIEADSSIRVLDLSDEQYYFVRTNGQKVFKATKQGDEGKFECLYWIYMNSRCIETKYK